MKKICLWAFALVTLFFSCTDEGVDWFPGYPRDSYICGFSDADTLTTHLKVVEIDKEKRTVKTSGAASEGYTDFYLEFGMKTGLYMDMYSTRSSTDYQKYLALTDALHDTSFKHSSIRPYGILCEDGYSLAINDTIANISVYAVKSNGGDDSAMEDVTDEMFILYNDYLKVVASGYQNYTGSNAYHHSSMKDGFPYALIGEPLREFNKSPKSFVSYHVLLRWERRNGGKNDTPLLITVRMKSGKELQTYLLQK